MKDQDAAIDLKKGCQTLDGPTALGYVRARKSDPRGDIGRAERQRQFLGALLKKAATPSTVLIPWRYKSFADSAATGLEVGQTTSFTRRRADAPGPAGVDSGETLSLVVPIETAALQTPNAGVAVKWNTAQAKALFNAIQQDQPAHHPARRHRPRLTRCGVRSPRATSGAGGPSPCAGSGWCPRRSG